MSALIDKSLKEMSSIQNHIDNILFMLDDDYHDSHLKMSVVFFRITQLYEKLKKHHFRPWRFIGISFPILEAAYKLQFRTELQEDICKELGPHMHLFLFLRRQEECLILYQSLLNGNKIPWLVISKDNDLDTALTYADHLVMVGGRLEIPSCHTIPPNIMKLMAWKPTRHMKKNKS
jgi:hypothetical protein